MFIWVKFIQKQQKYPKKKTVNFVRGCRTLLFNYKITVKYMFWRENPFQDA